MNIVTGGFFHESNTFNPIITKEDEFLVFRKEEIFENRDSYLMAKGIIEYFENKPEYNLFPLIFAKAVPNGEVDYDFYHRLKKEFFDILMSIDCRVDAFVLALHGSMRVKDIGSAESDLLLAIRQIFPDTPIICALDMHATMTETMLTNANAFIGFKTAPHIDAYETGFKAAEITACLLTEKINLCMEYQKIDCLIAGEKSETECEPMKSLIAELRLIEQDNEIFTASYLLGFPWADTLENGVTALVVSKNNQQKAKDYSVRLAEKFKEKRSQFRFSVEAGQPEEVLIKALLENRKPVFVSDSGDNPTAGSTGDNTTIINLLSNNFKEFHSHKNILIAGIYDPYAVEFCKQKMNQEISLPVGGNFDTFYCKPVKLKGIPVKYDSGFSAFKSELILFKTNEFELILSSKHIGFTSTDIFKALDIEYLNKDIIIVKLGYLTEDFIEITPKAYLALSQGCTDEVLERLSYQKKFDLV